MPWINRKPDLTYLGIKAEFPLTPADQEEYLSFIPWDDSDEYFEQLMAPEKQGSWESAFKESAREVCMACG